MRTNVYSTKIDNFSTYGNINPYTGKAGTKKYYGLSKSLKLKIVDDYLVSYKKRE